MLERVPADRPIPWALVGVVLVIAVIESFLWHHRAWFADEASWYWQSKGQLVEDRQLEGDIAIVGSSVLFHGLDPLEIQSLSDNQAHVTNLSLNGLQLPFQAQMLDRYLDRESPPQWLIMELRDGATIERSAWTSGPYWRFWATWDEFFASDFYEWNPSLAMDFAAHRVLASYSYRRGLDNLFFSSLRNRRLETQYHERNLANLAEMIDHQGFCRGSFEQPLTVEEIPQPKFRPFEVDSVGERWIQHVLQTCDENEISLLILNPPVPEFVQQDRDDSGYEEAFQAYLQEWKQQFPDLKIEILRPRNFDLSDFADDHHFSFQGAHRLGSEVADWINQASAKGEIKH